MSNEQVEEEFIGRDDDIEFFDKWLADPEAAPVIYIHDVTEENEKKGGIGKTRLLRKYYDLILKNHENIIPVFVDFFSVVDRDSVIIAELATQAIETKNPRWAPTTFFALLLQYHRAMREKRTQTSRLREMLANELANELRALDERWAETNTSLLFFFDTFELIEHNPITAVLNTAAMFPDRYQSGRVRAIIAGRNSLDWTHQNWVGREGEVLVRTLSPFSIEEMKEYLKIRLHIFDIDQLPPEKVEALHIRTEGRPILIGLAADVLNKRIRNLDTLIAIDQPFEASLVEEINKFDTPIKVAILSMAHIYHRFDAEFLNRLMSLSALHDFFAGKNYQELAAELANLSFVRRSGTDGGFVLHDEMRRLINQYCWEQQDQDESTRRELSSMAIDYYDDLIDKPADDDAEEKKQSYVVERLFHELFIDLESGLASFKEHFNLASGLTLRNFARALFQELRKFTHRFSLERRLEILFFEARLLREEEKVQSALDILNQLERNSMWAEQHRSDLLFEKGSCYLRLSQFEQAIECFKANLMIEQTNEDRSRYARILDQMGYAYRREGLYGEAMHFYEEALLAQRSLENPQEYAMLLNNIGNVQRLIGGMLEEALSSCKQALSIRRDLFKHGKVSEYDIGLSLSTLGHIYHILGMLSEEEKAYEEAFEIFNRLSDRSAIADSYNNLGRFLIQKGDLNEALDKFEQAARVASGGVNRGAEIESFNQRARVAQKKEQWEQAAALLEQAIMISRGSNMRFQIAENLLYLAVSYDHLGRPAQEQIREAKRLARENGYSYLLAKAGEFQGDIFFGKGEYQSTFKQYRVACRYMAPRGTPEFDRILRKLEDQLLKVPSGFLPGILDSLLEYWSELGLNGQYPQLLRICREVSKNMLLEKLPDEKPEAFSEGTSDD